MPALKKMKDGLVDRYRKANQENPKLLYTDRDCCSTDGNSKYNELFEEWPELLVRLDIFHFMRRLAAGVTTESHPLYGIFMQRLSRAIFEWDEKDYKLLCAAKKCQLVETGIAEPSDSAVR